MLGPRGHPVIIPVVDFPNQFWYHLSILANALCRHPAQMLVYVRRAGRDRRVCLVYLLICKLFAAHGYNLTARVVYLCPTDMMRYAGMTKVPHVHERPGHMQALAAPVAL